MASYRGRAVVALAVLVAAGGLAIGLPTGAQAEQASQPSLALAGRLDAGDRATCAVLANGSVRCWGYGADGELGYGNTSNVGDDETPGSVGPVDLGAGRTAKAVAVGDYHSCALLDDGSVRCWGFGGDGRLGYGPPIGTTNIGDDEPPGLVGPVDLDPDPNSTGVAVAITAGGAHTCAILLGGSVRCWGFGFDGQLGRGVEKENSSNSIGDDESPASVPPVDLDPDPNSTGVATAITAGGRHTCAILDSGSVRCWGAGAAGALGYGSTADIGDDEPPGVAGPVDLDPGAGTGTAKAIAAGGAHTCALLVNGDVRCWGYGGNGELGYGNTASIGDNANEFPSTVGPVDLDPGPGTGTTQAIAAGDHSCAQLVGGSVRCWGAGRAGELGYGNTTKIGDNESPGSAGPVNLGPGAAAAALTAGRIRTCARLDDGNVRCWGYGNSGRLGLCSTNSIGDDEEPASVGPIDLESPGSCPPVPAIDGGGAGVGDTGGGGVITTPGTGGAATTPSGGAQTGAGKSPDPRALEVARARALRSCNLQASRKPRRKRKSARKACLKRYGKTPGRVAGLRAKAVSQSKIVLTFKAPGTDGRRPPAARAYLIKQSSGPIGSSRAFSRARTLCKGSCRFSITEVGTKVKLTITDLRPGTTYYYSIAARDNVSKRLGRRSKAVKAKTR